ncbi:histone promoter control 2 [Diaporthe amygdali]|uniref:histone promoter control 2 n=1 Tax=Phomopsis amygdali TaxID=1214568 RepID=UPI0022FF2240|nr:histone promoter control 2 [Diaporthe amygdali]KAJ0109007.1 histone promoter control 2 [Diaporthe amygdali]
MSSSPTSLSSPPASSISNPSSPSRLNVGRANIEMDEIVVDTASGPRFGVVAPPAPPPPDVPLTAAGLPRKKPGRKPGSTVKPKVNPDGTPVAEAAKVRKPRKPRDPNAPPIQRKRKIAATQEIADAGQPSAASASSVPNPHQQATEASPMRMDLDSRPAAAATPSSSSNNTPNQQSNPAKIPKREGGPSFMSSLLNRDSPPPLPAPPAPVRMAFDPVRSSSYDPVRETMVTRDPYGTSSLASPRGPAQMTNRASASPSISSLIDAPPPSNSKVVSPTQAHSSFHSTTQGRFQDPSSLPPSPSNQVRKDPPPMSGPAPKSSTVEIKKPGPPPMMPQPPKEPPKAEPYKPTAPASAGVSASATMPAPSKKVATVVAQTRKEKKPVSSSSSSPKMGSLKNALPDLAPLPGTSNDRSILDFGKVAPGEEKEAPSIILHIPLNGEGNKYVNFMRLAESKYGWDALHPREAANRDRKARIAAASAALERQQSGRDSAEEEDPEFNASEDENSNIEMGGMGNNGGLTSGADAAAPEKPKRKKRNWREDEYDRGDDFVDDSELLWEEQAAAVQDGFFVYSGPLVQELPKAPEREGPAKRGRGRGGGPGSRGGRGRGEGGRGRGGGPGSRGGTTTRKPRITKAEKQQLDREKAEREQKAQQLAASKSNSGTNGNAAGSYGLLSGLVGPNASVPSLSAGLGAGIMNS